MKQRLPHFGTVTSAVRDCLLLEDTCVVLSERTGRTIAAGQIIKEKTWDEYATELVAALTSSRIFPALGSDLAKLVAPFHSYRASYEQLNSVLSTMQTGDQTIQRAVMRLLILDFAIRYSALCVAEAASPADGLPLWSQPDGGSRYWREAVEAHFPGVTLVGSSHLNGDCASKLGMHPSKFKRCLYDNDFPGSQALQKLFPDASAFTKALRYYAAFRLCRKLEASFGQVELEAWLDTWTFATKWMHGIFFPVMTNFSTDNRNRLVRRVLIGGVADEMVASLLKQKLAETIPPRIRPDLLALAGNDPVSVLVEYVDFCNCYQDPPTGACWEKSFLAHREELFGFLKTGAFPYTRKPNSKFLLQRLPQLAKSANDQKQQEKILREIIEADPNGCDAFQLLGQLCQNSGRLEEAWKWFEQANRINPSFVLPLYSLADSKSRAGFHREAVSIASTIPAPGLGHGSRLYLTAICLIRTRAYADAIPLLEAAFSAGWRPGESAALLALCYERLELPQPEAVRAAQKWKKEAQHRGFRIEDVAKLIS